MKTTLAAYWPRVYAMHESGRALARVGSAAATSKPAMAHLYNLRLLAAAVAGGARRIGRRAPPPFLSRVRSMACIKYRNELSGEDMWVGADITLVCDSATDEKKYMYDHKD